MIGISLSSFANGKDAMLKTRKPKKKNERKKLIKECHSLWSQAVKIRDGNQCRICGSASGLQSHHIFSDRMHSSTRYMLSNGIALCFRHHYPLGHSDPCTMRENIVKAIGEKAYRALESYVMPDRVVKYTDSDLREIKNQLRDV
jgi:5-methylcytosine-specific restriction endonuclease McrA